MKVIDVKPQSGAVVLSRDNAKRYVEGFSEGAETRSLRQQMKEILGEYEGLNRRLVEVSAALIQSQEMYSSATEPLPNYEVSVPSGSPLIGKSIGELKFWQSTGGTIVAIRRKQRVILSPGPYAELYDGDMLQEIAPHILHNEFKNPPPSPRDTDLVAVFDGGSALLAQEGGFPTVEAVRALGAEEEELIYLFAVDEIGFFLLERPSKTVKAALQRAPTTAFRTMEPRFMRLAAPTALHLMNWYRTNRFCGCCGAPTVREDKERAMRSTMPLTVEGFTRRCSPSACWVDWPPRCAKYIMTCPGKWLQTERRNPRKWQYPRDRGASWSVYSAYWS